MVFKYLDPSRNSTKQRSAFGNSVGVLFVILTGWLSLLMPTSQVAGFQQKTEATKVDDRKTTARDQESKKGVGIESAFPKLRFVRPVHLTHLNDDRLFVVEQRGVVHVFKNHSDTDRTEIFLDIQDRVSRVSNEEGLLGFAFHPNFKENGQFFVHYSSSVKDMTGIVARYRVNPDMPNRALADSEEIILEVKQPFRNHNGGAIAFGRDGMLYISFGDGGKHYDPFTNGQNLKTLLGKMLRIDVDHQDQDKAYAIPKDNPFVSVEGARQEIYALGLRNVWRFSVDRETGDIWAGDVGQNRFDEINLIVKGANYGWNRWEAESPMKPETEMATSKHQTPIVTIGREWGLSITGGNVYRGKRFPELTGNYFYGDYITGNLWRLWKNEKGEFTSELVRRTGRSIAAFGEDADGEVFLMSFDGYLYRIVPTDQPENFSRVGPKQFLSPICLTTSRKKRCLQNTWLIR